MFSIYSLKSCFQHWLRPLLTFLHAKGITANHVTLIALGMSVSAGAILLLVARVELFIILPFILFIRMALNAIDGMLAREFHQQSRVGALLNELGDVISDAALFLPFAFISGSSSLLIMVLIFLAILTEFCGVVVQTLTGTRNYAGPMGKSDRAFIFAVWSTVIVLWPATLAYSNYLWCAVNALLLWTLFNRCRAVQQESAKA